MNNFDCEVDVGLSQRNNSLLFLIVLLSIFGCSKKKDSDTSSASSCTTLDWLAADSSNVAGPGTLTVSPLNTSNGDIQSITALGNTSGSQHAIPSDHIYFNLSNTTADSTNVYAVANATVTEATVQGANEYHLVLKVNSSFYYFYNHIHLVSGIAAGSTVTAGQQIGTNSGLAAAVDLGVYDGNVTLTGFVNKCRMGYELHSVSPLKYYSGSLATTLYGLVNRSGTDKDGKIDFDVDGELVGDWAVQGTSEASITTSSLIAFHYDVVNPTQMRITIGGTLGIDAAVYGILNTSPVDFKSVTSSTGKIVYQLGKVAYTGAAPAAQSAILVVQMLDSGTVKIEAFSSSSATDGSFDSSATTYVR